MEQLQLELESLVYKEEQEWLDTVIQDLEITDNFTEKSRVQIIKIIIASFGVLLQTADKIVPCGPNQAVKDMLVFNHDAWPTNQVNSLILDNRQWFQPLLKSKGCCTEATASQWVSLKILVSTHFKDKAYVDLWATPLTTTPYNEDLKDVLHQVEILLVLPISAAQCERANSAQNRIKNDSRSCRVVEHWKN
ncbi:hypothetical protein ACROYT_G025396 [Oculina patagonica]